MTGEPPRAAPLAARSVVTEAVRARLGERFATSRTADSGHLELFLVAPTSTDVAFVEAVAREAGLAGVARVRTFELEWLMAWAELSPELVRLREQHVLSSSPGPSLALPPHRIHLLAHALDAAVALHKRFGSFVTLRVGLLAYPPDGVTPVRHTRNRPEPPIEDATGLVAVALDRPAVVASGHTLHCKLLITNRTGEIMAGMTGASLVAEITDPSSDAVVGLYGGGHRAVGRYYSIPAHETVAIPLLVGTASLNPALGYAVPPGEWSLRIVLPEGRGRASPHKPERRLLLPSLPVRITD